MLVLARKLNESIIINGNITITVSRIGRFQVRLGIEAPKEIAIVREELKFASAIEDAIEQERREREKRR